MNEISAHNLGKNNIVENVLTVDINRIVSEAKEGYKRALVEAQIEAFGAQIDICTTKTRFKGKRLWLVCPKCKKRKGKLYMGNAIACRQCLGLIYRKQRYKGMIEDSIEY